MTTLYRRAQHGADKIRCPVPGCGSKFNAESYLAIHRKKTHGGQKSEVGEQYENEEVEVKKVLPSQPSVNADVQSDPEGEVKLEEQWSTHEEMRQAESGNSD